MVSDTAPAEEPDEGRRRPPDADGEQHLPRHTTINGGTFTLNASGTAITSSGFTVNLGGTLALDNTATLILDRIGDSAGITLNGATLTFTANASTVLASTETVGAITLGAGTSNIIQSSSNATAATALPDQHAAWSATPAPPSTSSV